MNHKSKKFVAFLPIPTLALIIVALELFVQPSLFYEPTWLLPIMNTVFVTLVSLIVAYFAMRSYRATGNIRVLLLGCGVLVFGIGAAVAGLVRSIPGHGANLNVTLYNTGALFGAIFHFAAALMLLTGISAEVKPERKGFWLAFSYAGVTALMACITIASLAGQIPYFFIQGVGPTYLRQWILSSADILFAFSFVVFMGAYLRTGEDFLYWYSSALALAAISLTAFLMESAVGSAVGWAGRFSQYLGGIYFLAAIKAAIRSAQVSRISFDHALTAYLGPAEESFRALADNSPDMIQRFDGQMKRIYVNQAGRRLYERSAGSINGNKVEEAGLTASSGGILKDKIQWVLDTAQPMEIEHYISTENGIRFYHSHCVPEFGADETVANVLVVSRDLTDRKHSEEELAKAHALLDTLLAQAFIGFALLDRELRFVLINEKLAELNGIPVDAHIGKRVHDIVPAVVPAVQDTVDRILATGQPVMNHELSGETALMPGIKRYWNESWYPMRDNSGAISGFGVVVQEITEHKRSEKLLRQAMETSEALNRISEALHATLDFNEIMQRIAAEGASLLGSESAAVSLRQGDSWVIGHVHGLPLDLVGAKMQNAQEQHAVIALQSRRPVAVDDAFNDDRFDREHFRRLNIRSVLVAPLIVLNEALGAIYFNYHTAQHEFSEAELNFSGQMASVAGVALANARLFEARKAAEDEVRKINRELEQRVKERTVEIEAQYKELEELNAITKQLTRKTIEAMESDRRALSKEIHDSIAGTLAAIKLNLESWLIPAVQDLAPPGLMPLESIVAHLSQAVKETRIISRQLRSPILDDLGLEAALIEHIKQFNEFYPKIEVVSQIEIAEQGIPSDVKTVLYRVVQEALNNAGKHSNATILRIELTSHQKQICLKVADNGSGFPLKDVLKDKSSLTGYGIHSMRERVEICKGKFEIHSEPGKGTAIDASIPT